MKWKYKTGVMIRPTIHTLWNFLRTLAFPHCSLSTFQNFSRTAPRIKPVARPLSQRWQDYPRRIIWHKIWELILYVQYQSQVDNVCVGKIQTFCFVSKSKVKLHRHIKRPEFPQKLWGGQFLAKFSQPCYRNDRRSLARTAGGLGRCKLPSGSMGQSPWKLQDFAISEALKWLRITKVLFLHSNRKTPEIITV